MEVKLMFSVFLVSVFMYVRAESCDRNNCFASNGLMCNNKGSCGCGSCTCEEGFGGPTCEECSTCPSVCEVYRKCVSCKVFMSRGSYSFIDCLDKCDSIMTPIPVYNKEDLSQFTNICEHVNQDNCVEIFSVGGMSVGYRDIYVYPELDCRPTVPTTKAPTTQPPSTTTTTTTTAPVEKTTNEATTEATTMMRNRNETKTNDSSKEVVDDTGVKQDDEGYRNKPEDVAPVAGSNRFQDEGSTATVLSSNFLVIVCVVLLAMLTL